MVDDPAPAPLSAPDAAAATPTLAKEVAPWQSKTLIASAIVALLPLIPGIGPVLTGIVATNPQAVTLFLGAVFGGLRLATHGKIKIPS